MRSTVMKISAGWHGVNGRRRLQPTQPLDCQPRTGKHIVAVDQNGAPGDSPALVACGGAFCRSCFRARKHSVPRTDFDERRSHGRRSWPSAACCTCAVSGGFLVLLRNGGPGHYRSVRLHGNLRASDRCPSKYSRHSPRPVRGQEISIAVNQPDGRPGKSRTLVERLQPPGLCWRSRPIAASGRFLSERQVQPGT